MRRPPFGRVAHLRTDSHFVVEDGILKRKKSPLATGKEPRLPQTQIDRLNAGEAVHFTGAPPGQREYHPVRPSRDPRFNAALPLLAQWEGYYQIHCRREALPVGDPDDTLYGAKQHRWYWAFVGLIKEGRSKEEISRTLDRAAGLLRYPVQWPNAFIKMYLKLSDFNYPAQVWGKLDWINSEKRIEMEEADRKASEEFQALMKKAIAEQVAREQPEDSLAWLYRDDEQ